MVTPKGESASPDTLFGTFRVHWFFIAVFGGSIAAGAALGHLHPAMLTWASLALLITALPILVWRWTLRRDRRAATAPAPPPPGAAGPEDAVPPAYAHAMGPGAAGGREG